eukprot:gene6917-8043_t
MDRFTKLQGEHVVLRAETKHESKQGTLFCTNQRLLWVEPGKQQASVYFHLTDIKTQFVSKESSQTAKALLRLNVKDHLDPTKTKAFLFEFTSLANARRDLYQYRDKIASVVKSSTPAPTAKVAPAPMGPPAPVVKVAPAPPVKETFRDGSMTEDEVKQRVVLLSSNPSLKALFNDLVGGGTISEADFWESRKAMLVNDSMRSDKQNMGLPSIFLSDVRPTTESVSTVKYRLTPSIIHQIFIQNPSVERAFKDNVPLKISEVEFWKKYLSSKYYYRDRNMNNPPPADDLFSNTALKEKKSQEEKEKEKEKVMRDNKKTVQENIINTELMEVVPEDLPRLKIQDQKRYFEGHSNDSQNEDNKKLLIGFWNDETRNIDPRFDKILSTKSPQVLEEVVSISSSSSDKAQSEYKLKENEFKAELYSSFRMTNELLRHFWASSYTPGRGRPPTAQQIEKNNRLSTAIGNQYDLLENKKRDLIRDKKINQASLITPILASLDKAVEKKHNMTST